MVLRKNLLLVHECKWRLTWHINVVNNLQWLVNRVVVVLVIVVFKLHVIDYNVLLTGLTTAFLLGMVMWLKLLGHFKCFLNAITLYYFKKFLTFVFLCADINRTTFYQLLLFLLEAFSVLHGEIRIDLLNLHLLLDLP